MKNSQTPQPSVILIKKPRLKGLVVFCGGIGLMVAAIALSLFFNWISGSLLTSGDHFTGIFATGGIVMGIVTCYKGLWLMLKGRDYVHGDRV